MAAQVALRRQQEAQLKRHLAQGLMKGAAPLKAPLRVKKGAIRPGVPCECLCLAVRQDVVNVRTSIPVLTLSVCGLGPGFVSVSLSNLALKCALLQRGACSRQVPAHSMCRSSSTTAPVPSAGTAHAGCTGMHAGQTLMQ